MEELKPCPFCGGKPHKGFWLENDNWAYASIQCGKCDAEIKKREAFSNISAQNPGNSFIKVEQEAIEAWNKRNEHN